jgi:hypothetical protein
MATTSERLHPTETAITVRVRNGKLSTTDGPFAETKEQVGGFFLVNARDLNEAIAVAASFHRCASGAWKSGRSWRPMDSSYGPEMVVTKVGSICKSKAFAVRLTDGDVYMKYMLLIYRDEQTLSETERQECYAESTRLVHEIQSNGQYLASNPLQPTSMATSVQVRNGKRLVTDGPFAETREQLGGYFLIDVKNLDEAIAIAARIPMARKGTVEVRPVIEIPGLPTE